jgi:hypothetical protein
MCQTSSTEWIAAASLLADTHRNCDQEAVYNTAKKDGEEVSWDDIETKEYEEAYSMDKDSILLNKQSDEMI